MSASVQAPAPADLDDRERLRARVAGMLFVITFLAAIPAVLLYRPLLDDPAWVLGAGSESGVLLGASLELLLIAANIGTALALFPILKRCSEALALGYVAARIVECVFIAVGLISLLAVVTLRQDAVGVTPGSLVAIGQSLVAVHDWTFLLGPGFVVGIGNGMLLGYLMYRSRLVPPRMAMLGLIGGPLLCASGLAVLFGAIEPGSPAQLLATIPEIAWEASLGVYLLAKGFQPSAPVFATTDDPRADAAVRFSAVASA